MKPSCLILNRPSCELTYLFSPKTPKYSSCTFLSIIIVSIHGACRGNGTSRARAAYGVYFGEDSPYNECGLLPETERQGSNAAVVYAAKRALEIFEDSVIPEERRLMQEVIIKTHSSYLFLSMVEDVRDWEDNGYIDSDGKSVINRFLIGKLDHLIEEAWDARRFETSFWLVGAEHNEEGVPLADEAFQRAREAEEDEDKDEDEEFTIRELSFGPCLEYWREDAPGDRDARELARRLKFRLHNEKAEANTDADAAREIAVVMRRLVLTGEDRPQSFECLFGTEWAKLKRLWAETRLEVLKEFEGGPTKHFSDLYDVDAPFLRPRKPNASEERELALSKAAGLPQETPCVHVYGFTVS